MSLAALKRRLTVGTVLDLEHYDPEINARIGGRRTITKVQTNAIASIPDAWTDEEKQRHPAGSWLEWPKADMVAINGDTFTVASAGSDLVLRYRIVTP